MLLAVSAFMFSCSDDDDLIDVGDGLNLADGYYLAIDGEDPEASTQLVLEKVELAGSNDPVDRDGYYGNYVFLNSGNYKLAQVANREVVAELGAVLADKEELAGDDPSTGYKIATPSEDAGAFNLSSGFYKVGYDEETNEILVMEVATVSLIGSATEGGWGSDTQLTAIGDPSEEDGWEFEGTNIILRNGAFKIRINNGWKMARFDEEGGGFAPFTNYGGSESLLEPGGSDIVFSGEGAYTVNVKLTNEGGAEMSMTRTGDAPEITFDPEEYQFGIIGDATARGWDADMNMHYKGIVDGKHTWLSVVTLLGTGNFKFRTNDSWDYNVGGSITLGEESEVFRDGSDIPTFGEGAYYVVLSTADEGETWQVTVTESGWGVIGDGSPQQNWDNDIQMDAAIVEGEEHYTITGAFTTGEWKFRAGGAWDLDLGGSLSDLAIGGGNITLDAAGEFTVTLIYDGEAYTATIE